MPSATFLSLFPLSLLGLPLLAAGAQRARPLAPELGRDATGEGQAFCRIEVERAEVYVDQTVRVRLVVGIEEDFAEFELVPLFRRPLDFAAQVVAPWWDERVTEEPGPEGAETIALGERITSGRTHVERRLDGGGFRVLELDGSLRPRTPGELVLGDTLLRFAHATAFREDLIGGRVAEDKVDAFVAAAPVTLRVRPLPGEGRPAGFGGAVGRFTVAASAAPRDVRVGETVVFELLVRGDGNLAEFDAPVFPAGRDFDVYGVLDDRASPVRRIRYDVAPRSSAVTEIPSLELAFFDPAPPVGYRVEPTPRMPLRVRAVETDVEPRDPEPVEGGAGRPERKVPWAVWGGAGGLAVLLLLLRARRRAT